MGGSAIHGLRVINVFAIRGAEWWDAKVTAWILVAAVLPFGGYVVDWWLARECRVATGAHSEAFRARHLRVVCNGAAPNGAPWTLLSKFPAA